MELIFIIAAIIISVVNSSNKRKKQAADAAKRQAQARSLEEEHARAEARSRDYQAQRRQQGERRGAPAAPTVQAETQAAAPTVQARTRAAAPEAAWRCSCGAANRQGGKFCINCGKPRYGGSMNYASAEGKAASSEGAAAPVMKPARPEGSPRPAAPTVRHVVKPLTESSHRHVESSMTGIEDCYDVPETEAHAKDAYAIGGDARELPYGLSLDRNAAVQGLLYAEILGKPKALRRRGA